ncbi:hypothetical protein MUN88_02040 [Gracilibacillus caseinilyticus]|uniref:Uncharacterized protein n=1 Tax=Gracilibacillus caseinilyticus TaxID=2932256 RepID=A0ABY4EXF5_9BACI|nr:hypothetical protein [Gracilibacillus caseinilyticus]UOQ48943.1 hypothetical protein MUN88_02040 [Gracilibacillus caseinilyticus]
MSTYESKEYKDVFYFKYKVMASTVEQAKQEANYVRTQLQKPHIKKFLNDNSLIQTVAKPEVNEVWGQLMQDVANHVEKNATIAPNVTLKMQLNRLSRSAGTKDSVKAFTTLEEASKFLGVEEMEAL